MTIERAKHTRLAGDGGCEHGIIRRIGSDHGRSNSRKNALSKVLQRLDVLGDFQLSQRPHRLKARVVQNALQFRQQEGRQDQRMAVGVTDELDESTGGTG